MQHLKNQSPLHKHVINEIINDSADYSGNFKEKLKARCEDIQKLLKELCTECGCNVWELLRDFDTNDIFCEEIHNQNLLAWFGYEEISNQIYYLLED